MGTKAYRRQPENVKGFSYNLPLILGASNENRYRQQNVIIYACKPEGNTKSQS